ncbi:hypothetical protein N7510_008586 [Penicillium lagena]|uniref:uncharacterized protein n=1 Tax=Penicillium lagena TaxID=94218 RepID=UPI002540D097|nr:uncharacterized protein N7510_008586 [Penicillium lagena]KAJ5605805.1 hypothetical protein N7510_008586 [Penicillium lagena]
MSEGINKELVVDLRRVPTGRNLIGIPSWSVGLRQKYITAVLLSVRRAGRLGLLGLVQETKHPHRNPPPTRALTVLTIPLWDWLHRLVSGHGRSPTRPAPIVSTDDVIHRPCVWNAPVSLPVQPSGPVRTLRGPSHLVCRPVI